MKLLRKEDISLHEYIRHQVLKDFIEVDINVPLILAIDSSSTSSFVYDALTNVIPKPNSIGRGWVYFDNSFDHIEQTNSIKVYDNSNVEISHANYMIDYKDGRIIFPNQTIIPAYVTYRWYYVSILNEWDMVNTSGPPAVVIDINSTVKSGFQLGGGKYVSRKVAFHVFASDQGERDDITEAIYDGINLKCCPNQEFSKGSPIDWDGSFNIDYIYSTISGSSSLTFEDTVSRNIYASFTSIPNRDFTALTDLNRYRSVVNCNMFHLEEG